ncbi:imidazole glycerol phosphate synthase subunit HisH [Buchnera aphidicola (Kurisakia onigurumii)]|uniref:imidazole glycerol phosphate synthase subunit HisH n=1 Tax=Buchnera aphidicola TaxID=9 RepID=UPI0031B6BB2C
MSIIIIDTGCSNLSSLSFAIHRLGYKPIITSNYKDIRIAKKIFIPGVGTAKTAMYNLNKYNIVQEIQEAKVPVLGICLGMQILGSYSMENNVKTKTLGIFDSIVVSMKKNKLSLPHIGWNYVLPVKNNVLLKNIKKKEYFYFIHQYIFPINIFTIAKSIYGESFSAIMCKKNFYGVQFHPEKSGKYGSILIKNFLEI